MMNGFKRFNFLEIMSVALKIIMQPLYIIYCPMEIYKNELLNAIPLIAVQSLWDSTIYYFELIYFTFNVKQLVITELHTTTQLQIGSGRRRAGSS